MERRFTNDVDGIHVEEREGASPKITGYAAVFYNRNDPGTEYELWEGARERIMPTAFDRALAEGDDVRGLYNHDPNHLLGRTASGTMKLEKFGKGLRYTIAPPDTQLARDVMESTRRGDLSGSSFAFRTETDEWHVEDGVQIREIRSVRLYDCGPVTFPAYKSSTTGLRSAGEPTEARSSFEAWQKQQTDAAALQANLKRYKDRAAEVQT